MFEAVLIPALRAFVMGSIITIGMIALLQFIIHVDKAVAWSVLAGAIVAWFAFLGEIDGEKRYLERLIERNKKELTTVKVMVSSEDGTQGTFLELPFGQEKIGAVCHALLYKTHFSQATFAGVLSRKEYEQLRELFLRRGLATWTNPAHNQGLALTLPGRAVVRRLSRMGK